MSKKKYILALDAGTTSVRAELFDYKSLEPQFSAARRLNIFYPKSGWAEQDGDEILAEQLACIKEVFSAADCSAADIVAVGITNQRETVLLWDAKTLKAVTPCISWQCRRTADYCSLLRRDGLEGMIKQKTGLVIDAYFSASKLRWLFDNTNGLRQRAERGELLAGTIDSFLVYALSKGKSHVTDPTNASRTMLYNIATMDWDEELLRLFNLPRAILPRIEPSAAHMGNMVLDGTKVPICGIAGDQQSSLIGQACFDKGDCKCTYGTGAFILSNIGSQPIISDLPLLTTVAYEIGGTTSYAIEGSVFNEGSTVQWLRELGLISSSADSERLAATVPNSGGVVLVPAFSGLGAPYWNMDCRAAIFGITRATSQAHIVRAGLESIALSVCDVIELMESIAGNKLDCLRADGGASENALLMQIQADLLNARICKAKDKEGSARGAAYLAALGCQRFDSIQQIKQHHAADKVFTPRLDEGTIKSLKSGWRAAIDSLLKQ